MGNLWCYAAVFGSEPYMDDLCATDQRLGHWSLGKNSDLEVLRVATNADRCQLPQNAIVPVWATETAEHTSRGQFIAIEFTLNIFGVVVGSETNAIVLITISG